MKDVYTLDHASGRTTKRYDLILTLIFLLRQFPQAPIFRTAATSRLLFGLKDFLLRGDRDVGIVD
jgi:hypothetical protein